MKKLTDLVPDISDDIDTGFPHIAERIVLFWGSVECVEYIETLLQYEPMPDRPQRQGFPFQVVIDLNKIYQYHGEQFPWQKSDTMKNAGSIWFNR